MKKHGFCSFIIALLLLSGCGFSRPETVKEEKEVVSETYEDVLVKARQIDADGNLYLAVTPQYLNEKGYEAGDLVQVMINEQSYEMAILACPSDDVSDEMACLFQSEADNKDLVYLHVQNGSFAKQAGIIDQSEKTLPDVSFHMIEKQNRSEEYPSDERLYQRSDERKDYPHLSDAEYANFRNVDTSGMGKGTLYRSSSPINPKIMRNKEADAALEAAKIKTIFNMADYENGMKQHPDYENSYYAGCNTIALNMSTVYETDEFKERLAKGFRFLLSNEGPYLIHCTEGKDRTGFAVAVLECFMGAGADEVISDYMRTYYNYIGVKLGSLVYHRIASRNIMKTIAKAFHVESIYEIDLQAKAEEYLLEIGLSAEEIEELRNALGRDFAQN